MSESFCDICFAPWGAGHKPECRSVPVPNAAPGVPLLRCPLCNDFGVRYDTTKRQLALDGLADHLSLCAVQVADDRLTKQLEQEQNR